MTSTHGHFPFFMSEPTIRLENSPTEEDRRKVLDGLLAHNKGQTGDDNYENLTFLLRDADGEVVGGLLGEIYWGWLHIDILWVDESWRKDGLGRKLMEAAEREAAERGCHSAFLDTFSFQALPFYLNLGYEIYGELADFPPGNRRYFLRKPLTKISQEENL